MTLDVVSCLALLDIHKAQTIPCVELDLFYLDSPRVAELLKQNRRYVFFCTGATWSELICNKSFQNHFDAALHFSLVQKGVLGSIQIASTDIFLITDAFAAPFDKMDIPNGLYLFELPLDSLHELLALKLHTYPAVLA